MFFCMIYGASNIHKFISNHNGTLLEKRKLIPKKPSYADGCTLHLQIYFFRLVKFPTKNPVSRQRNLDTIG